MNKAAEWRKNAEECRALAKQIKPEKYRDQLLQMAETWDRLASQQEAGAAPVQPEAAPAKPQKK
jgi:hypothetical protein